LNITRHSILILAAAAVSAAVFSCRREPAEPVTPDAEVQAEAPAAAPPPPQAKPPEPADEEPLLLDEPGEGYDGPAADNSRCHVCHMNYDAEELAVTHARNFVSCEDCHGPSDAHCSDEDNVTPPDRMFAEDDIAAFCMGCHPAAKIDIQPHEQLLAAPEAERPKCTGCHGEHVLNYRTRRWDKQTGKLL
jgi:hypothetical protein